MRYGGSGPDAGHPLSNHLIDVVWMKKFTPANVHDFFSRKTGVVEHASVAVIDCPFWCSAPQHLRNGFSKLTQVEFALEKFFCRKFGVRNVPNEGAEGPTLAQLQGMISNSTGNSTPLRRRAVTSMRRRNMGPSPVARK